MPEIEGVYSGVHGRISMTKFLKFLFQILVPTKSTIGFVSNFKKFSFRRCRRFFPNFNIIEFNCKGVTFAGSKGVEIVCFFLNLSKVIFSPKT